MRKIGMAVAVTASALGMAMGTFTMTPLASAAQVSPAPPAPVLVAGSSPIHMMNCVGGTGAEGCGPGFIWHDGWRGFACYPC